MIARKLGWACLAAFSLLLVIQTGFFLAVLWYSTHNPSNTAFMRATLAQLRTQQVDATLQQHWVPYPAISATLKRAVVAAEDANFLTHGGVEWGAIRQAWQYNRQQGDSVRGGSTITQQLAKNLFLSGKRSYLRKVQELILSYMIELSMSKERILELYLNTAQWGVHLFGAEAAAQHYYRTSAASLSEPQAARLAAMLPNPAYYQRYGNTAYLQARTRTIAQRMRLVQVP